MSTSDKKRPKFPTNIYTRTTTPSPKPTSGAHTQHPTMLSQQVVQVLYGTFMATEVAYYTYIYAKISRDRYQQVTGNTRAAILSGRFLASVVGQTLVSTGTMDLRQLNYITLGGK